MFRFGLLVCTGVLCIFGSKVIKLAGAGALGALIVPMVAAGGWRRQGLTESVENISKSLKCCWIVFQPLLFGLIGAAVDINTLEKDKIGKNVFVTKNVFVKMVKCIRKLPVY